MKYSTDEIRHRIRSIEKILNMPPEKISITETFKKYGELRLQELRDELTKREHNEKTPAA
jgi:hypothetical protein